MKKLAYLGLAAVLAVSMAGCSSKKDDSAAAASADAQDTAQEVATASPEEESNTTILSSEDFEPFFKGLFSLTEDQFDLMNRDESIDNPTYFSNLQSYREIMENTFKDYLSPEMLEKLKKENAKLDFDLPKKSQINDFVVDASGEVKSLRINASRPLGDEMMYEVIVTTTNKVTPFNEFAKHYKWSNSEGYYIQAETADNKNGTWDIDEQSEEPTYVYADNQAVSDYMRIESSYWVTVKTDDAGKFKIDGFKQGGNLEVDRTSRQRLDNTGYITRVPYYDTVSEQEKALVGQLFKTMMTAPKETYQYYNKVIGGGSVELAQNFWRDQNMGDLISLKEDCYQTAFQPTMSPYKNDIEKIDYDETKLQIAPSIYSTQLQPAFMVTVPAKVISKYNNTDYYLYKYYVGTENGKIETIQFIRLSKITPEQYEAGVTLPDQDPAAMSEEGSDQAAEETTQSGDEAAESTDAAARETESAESPSEDAAAESPAN